MSRIDYFVTSDPLNMIAFNILDLDVNLSDHLPVMVVFSCNLPNDITERKPSLDPCVVNFRWDHAKLDLYYHHTLVLLQPVLDELNLYESM